MSHLPRRAEAELMDDPAVAMAYHQADFSEPNQRLVERAIELTAALGAGPESPLEVIDLGCGPAEIPLRLAARCPGWHITAVDGAPAMLSIARREIDRAGHRSRITLVLADAVRSGQPGGTFDVVVSNSLLHHVRSPAQLWREIDRLVRPGGQVLLRDLFRPDDAATIDALVQATVPADQPILQREFRNSLNAAYTVREVHEQLRQADMDWLAVEVVSERHLEAAGVRPPEPAESLDL